MTVITPPLFQSVDGAYAGRHLGIPYRDLLAEGVLTSADLVVSERGAGANMSVDVSSGVAWVSGDDNTATQPLYRCYNDGTVNLTISAADGSNERIDLVIAEVRDSDFSGVSQDWRLRVVAGTPAGSPSAPALPDNAIALAEVSVPASDTTISDAQITDVRPRAYVLPGRVPHCRVYRNSIQTVSNGAATALGFNATDSDPLGWHDTSTNNDRVTPDLAGLYLVTATMTWYNSAGGSTRLMGIRKNGTSYSEARASVSPQGGSGVSHAISRVVDLNGTTDYVGADCYQDSGGNLNVFADGSGTPLRLDVVYIGAYS